MSKEVEVHFVTDQNGHIRAASSDGLSGALRDILQYHIPVSIIENVEWGSPYSHGMLSQYWQAMEKSGWKVTSRWIEL